VRSQTFFLPPDVALPWRPCDPSSRSV
jgi:hypothetical protein